MYVIARLAERRDAVEAPDVSLAGVVRGERLLLVAAEPVSKVLEVLRAGHDVVGGIRQIARAEPVAGARNQLHQADRARRRARCWNELRLRVRDRRDQLRRKVVLPRLAVDDRAERNPRLEELLLDLLGQHADLLRSLDHRLNRRLRHLGRSLLYATR